jgi:hypothetical protein
MASKSFFFGFPGSIDEISKHNTDAPQQHHAEIKRGKLKSPIIALLRENHL